MGVNQLAAAMAMDRTTLAANLKPLDREGFLRLTVNPEDRRARLIKITVKGEKQLEQCLPLWSEAQTHFEEQYGAEKAKNARELLTEVLLTGLDPWAE